MFLSTFDVYKVWLFVMILRIPTVVAAVLEKKHLSPFWWSTKELTEESALFLNLIESFNFQHCEWSLFTCKVGEYFYVGVVLNHCL